MDEERKLQQDVLDELRFDPSVEASDIGVTARDGIVTLTGNVGSYLERVSAERITKRVDGVRAILNELTVKIPGISKRDDYDIAEAALNALKWHVAVPREKIRILVSDGWVTLEGDVDFRHQKESVAQALEGMTGIRGISNLLVIRAAAKPREVKSQIRAAFHRSAEIDADSIEVQTSDGAVTLSGTVRSSIERNEAEEAAWRAHGVASVKNELTILPAR